MKLLFSRASLDDAERIENFIKPIFDEHVAVHYTNKGIKEFYRYINPKAIAKRLNENHQLICATSSGQTIGIIEIRNNNHISLLFVASKQQRKGIGFSLIHETLKVISLNNPNQKKITVNSSPNSLTAYERFGFVKKDSEQEKNGIRFTPMELNILK